MCSKNTKSTSHKLIAMTPSDQVEHILYNGGKIQACIAEIKRKGGLEADLQEVASKFGDYVFKRSVKLLVQIFEKKAALVQKSAMSLGLVSQKDGSFELTPKGELEVLSGRKYGRPAKGWLETNPMLYVVKYRFETRPSVGKELFEALCKAKDDNSRLDICAGFLGRRMDLEELETDIQAMDQDILMNYPVRSEYLEQFRDAYSFFEDVGIEAREELGDEETFVLDKDSRRQGEMDSLMGPHLVSQDPEDKIRGFLLMLCKARQDKLTGSTLWDKVFRPILDHYSPESDYGPAVDYVNLPLTPQEVKAQKDDFPYEPNVDYEEVTKTYKQDELVPVEKLSPKVKARLEAAGQLKPNQYKVLFHRELKKPVYVNDRPLIVEYNHEESADFKLNKLFELKEDFSDFKRQLVDSQMSFPEGREILHLPSWKENIMDLVLVRTMSRFLKINPQGDFTSWEFKSFRAKEEAFAS